jgi:hypothetical protein
MPKRFTKRKAATAATDSATAAQDKTNRRLTERVKRALRKRRRAKSHQ